MQKKSLRLNLVKEKSEILKLILQTLKLKKHDILIFILLICASVLRIYRLGYYDFWYDEVITFYRSLDIFRILRNNLIGYAYDPPLFYIIISPFVRLTQNEFFLRLISAFIGIITVYCGYLLGKSFRSKRFGILITFLLTISPLHIHYSQEFRGYSFIICFVLLSYLSLYRYLITKRNKYFILWIIISVFTLYLHNITIFVFWAQIIYLSIEYKKIKEYFPKFLLGFFIIFCLYLSWIFQLPKQIHFATITKDISWIPKGSPFKVIQTFGILSGGYNVDKPTLIFISFIYFMLFLRGLFSCRDKTIKKLLLTWFFVPLLMLYLLSIYFQPIYLPRTIIYIMPAYLAVIAFGILSISQKARRYIIVIILIFNIKALYNYYQNNVYFSQDYRIGVPRRLRIKEPINFIKEKFGKDIPLLHVCRNTLFPFFFKELDNPQYIVRVNKIEPYFKAENFIKGKYIKTKYTYPKCIKEISRRFNKILLIYSDWEYSYDRSIHNKEIIKVKQFIDKEYRLIQKKDFQDLTLFFYRKR